MHDSSSSAPSPARPEAAALHARFLRLLPRIERHARIAFRHVRCPGRKDDAVSETVGIAWKWFVALAGRGKDAAAFVATLARLAVLAVRCDRRVCGAEKPKDVLSPRAQKRRGFAVGKLPDFSTLNANPLQEALIDNTATPPDEQAIFRLDFPVWLASLDERRRRIALALMVGERTLNVANRHGLSPARISQLRRDFKDAWDHFCE